MNTTPLLIAAAASALLLASHPADASALRFVADAAPLQSVDFSVKLPLRNSAELDELIHLQSSPNSPFFRHFLTPAQFRASFGASPASFARAAAALRASGLTVTRVDSQMLHVRGPVAAVNAAFHTQLGIARDADRSVRLAARTPVTVPANLAVLGATVSGFGTTVRPQPLFARTAAPQNRYSPFGSYWFDDLKQAYEYPAYSVANGKGITVATVGDSDFSSADAKAYFTHERLTSGGLGPTPSITHVLLPGASAFDPTTGISDEADLDVQMVGGSAPGANVLGVAVGGPAEPFLNAYAYLVESNVASIVSTSYGECELYYTAAYNNGVDNTSILQSYHDLFRQGNSQGITFVFSSGDNSGTECLPVAYFGPGTGKSYNPLPAGAGIWVDDPNVTGVGGTNLETSFVKNSLQSTYVSENEIGDRITTPLDFYGTGNTIKGALWGSGGGPSAIFAKPSYQNLIPTGYRTRAVPDVSMTMGGCPFYGPSVTVDCGSNRDSGDVAVVGGQLVGLIGTSASAPEFAGLLAVTESVLGTRLGNANEYIYKLAAENATGDYYHQGIPAYNGVVRIAAGQKGYNTIVGVGTPIAKNFVGLPKTALAGNPQTPSNP